MICHALLDKATCRRYNFDGHGLVAQLGAHHIRIVGVGSSNLLKSTKEKYRHRAVFFFGMAFTQRRFEELNATRTSVAGDGWTEPNLYLRKAQM